MTFERWTDRTVPMATDRRSRMHPDFPVEVWACLNPAHRSVTWVNDLARCDACGLTSEMTREFTEGTELARVQAIAADLDGFIGRRAAELAKPAIEEAERSRLAFECRLPDAQAEFARQRTGLERRIERLEGQLAAAKAKSKSNAEIAAGALDRLRLAGLTGD